MGATNPSLDKIERAILRALSAHASLPIDRLATASDLTIDQARRGVERLRYKDLISADQQVTHQTTLGMEGQQALAKGLPERRLVHAVRDGVQRVADAVAKGFLGQEEVSAAVSNARKNGWIRFAEGGTIVLAEGQGDVKSPEEEALELIAGGSSAENLKGRALEGFERLKKRPDYVIATENKSLVLSLSEMGRSVSPQALEDNATVKRLTPDLITGGKWRTVTIDAIDTSSPVPSVFPGRSHPLSDMIDEIKEIFVGMGFTEISGAFVQSAFWNFDALYTPQDHPAREMQDTFYLKSKARPIPASSQLVSKVSRIHNKGWGGWDAATGERLVLRTHTTPVTLQHLATEKPEYGRFFSIGRVFRNEKVSYKHLVEFHQVEGVATHPGASLRDIIGLQTEFYKKLGIQRIKFWPTFFPYTEPSLQSMVYNEKLGKWVELFGMGIFRPEVVRPLTLKNPVLAWGGGLERVAMLKFSLDDVRELYKSRISWLRSVPKCPL